MKQLVVIIFGFLLSYPVWAKDLDGYKRVIAANLAQIDAFKWTDWRVNRISRNEKTTKHETFDPKRSPPWRLISINRQAPNKKQREEYNRKQVKNRQQSKQSLKIDKLSDIVFFQSLAIVDTQDQLITFSFTPRLRKFGAKGHDKFAGLLCLDAATGTLKSLKIENTDELRPHYFVIFNRFSLNMEFKKQKQQLLMVKLVTNIEGKAGFFKTIKQKLEQIYSDHVFLGQQ